MKRFSLCVFALSILLLSACGGGGSGSNSRPTVMPPSGLSGSARADIGEAIASIGRAADHIVITDIQVATPNQPFQGVRADSSCFSFSASCSSTLPGVLTLRFTPEDVSTIAPTTTIQRVAEQQGVPIGSITGPTSIGDYQVLGGWLDEQFFFVDYSQWRGQLGEATVNGYRTIMAGSVGNQPRTNPVSGSATWTGAMVGIDRQPPSDPLRGDATLTYDFAYEDIELAFTNVQSLSGASYSNTQWRNIPVRRGRFSFGDGRTGDYMSGSFYGDQHEEVGGVFDQSQVVGAFGAKR